MNEQVLHKLKVLAESAKYDVSCASSGTVRRNTKGGVGNTVGGVGICHSFAEDGRCISLLKIMLTNYCIYDCAYCINRVSNDIPRATLSVTELVELTMEFYRRNYIEGLFLSSGVVRNPDYTMERLVRVAKDLRVKHRFNGYIHLKSIPGASQELVHEAGLYADRMSVNLEIPTERNLKLLAPEKDHRSVYLPMKYIQQGVLESAEERKLHRHAPFCAGRTEHADDCRCHRRDRQGHPQRIVGALPPAHDEAGLLFGLCGGEHVRQTPALAETASAGAREPLVSGRLALAVLPIQGRRTGGRRFAPPGYGD